MRESTVASSNPFECFIPALVWFRLAVHLAECVRSDHACDHVLVLDPYDPLVGDGDTLATLHRAEQEEIHYV